MKLSRNMRAFLTTIAVSEATQSLGDSGYNVCVGGSLFDSYADHPRRPVWINGIQKYSTAAGRYQVLAWVWDHYRPVLKLPDFGPDSQDRIAVRMIQECRAYVDIEDGRFETALRKCRSRWASLPGAGYGQPEQDLSTLKRIYLAAGGMMTGSKNERRA